VYDGTVRTSLVWVDPQAGKITEFLKLPSGDTSYAGRSCTRAALGQLLSGTKARPALSGQGASARNESGGAGRRAAASRAMTTSGVHGTPRAAAALTASSCLSAAHLHFPLEAATLPGTNRMVVIELAGRSIPCPTTMPWKRRSPLPI